MMNRDPQKLVMTLEQAVAWRNELRKNGRKLAVTNGCFDILHRGHAQYLYESRELADALLILMNSDNAVRSLKGPTRPIVPEEHRAYMLAALESVDAVVIFDSARCDRELLAIAPDLYVKGGDYTLDSLESSEHAALDRCGAKIVFKPFVEGFSTSNIIAKIKQ